jgi:leader peptidase (prepilin peptidase)/N-methyltransferase
MLMVIQSMRGVVLLFLGIGSAADLKKKEIPVWLFLLFGGLGIVLQTGLFLAGRRYDAWYLTFSWVLGGFMGLLLAVISKVTGEAIGYGDAWTASVIGIWLGWNVLLEVFMFGIFLTAVYGGILFFIGKEDKKKKVPFLPFLLSGYILWLILWW